MSRPIVEQLRTWPRNLSTALGGGLSTSLNGGMSTSMYGGLSTAIGGGMSTSSSNMGLAQMKLISLKMLFLI